MFCRKTAATVNTDGFVAVPNGERVVILEVDRGCVSKHEDISFRHIVALCPTLPNAKLRWCIVVTAVRAVVLKGRTVDELIFLTVHLNIYIERERVEIVKNFLWGGLADVLQIIVCYLATIVIPQSHLTRWKVSLPRAFGVRAWHREGFQHHIFVVAEKHFYVWHCHNHMDDANAVRVTVDDVTEDIKGVIRLKVYLLQSYLHMKPAEHHLLRMFRVGTGHIPYLLCPA